MENTLFINKHASSCWLINAANDSKDGFRLGTSKFSTKNIQENFFWSNLEVERSIGGVDDQHGQRRVRSCQIFPVLCDGHVFDLLQVEAVVVVVGVVGGVRQQAAAVVEGQPRHAPLAGEAGLELRPDEVRALGRVDALQVDGQTLREREDPGLAFGLRRGSK